MCMTFEQGINFVHPYKFVLPVHFNCATLDNLKQTIQFKEHSQNVG